MDEHQDLLSNPASAVFAAARSEFLDYFADLESIVSSMLERAGIPPNLKEPFGHRLKEFREITKVSIVAKCRIGQRNSLVDAISKLLPIRADIVHSRMQVRELDGEPVAVFVNSQLALNPDAPIRLLTLNRLRHHTASIARYAERLQELKRPVNPAS